MLIKKLYFLFYLIIHIQLSSLHTFAMMSPDSESDGLCGIPAKAVLNFTLGNGILYESRAFQAKINIVDTSSIEYQIVPLHAHLHNWEDWHPANWIELFQITRALEDFSDKTGSLDNAHSVKGFQLSGSQYMDEETEIQKTKFIFTPCYTSDFSTQLLEKKIDSKRATTPIRGSFIESCTERVNQIYTDRMSQTLIRNAINQFQRIERSRYQKPKESLADPSFCYDCIHSTEQETTHLQSEKPFWLLMQREGAKGEIYYDMPHTQHICSLHQCTDVMTLELSQTLLRLAASIAKESGSHNFDILIRSYNNIADKHLTCRLTPKMLSYCSPRKKSTDTESSEDSASFIQLPIKTPKPFLRQGRSKKLEIIMPIVSTQIVVVESAPPPPSKKGQQRLRKTISDASKYNAW